jgi:hypothetical protein
MKTFTLVLSAFATVATLAGCHHDGAARRAEVHAANAGHEAAAAGKEVGYAAKDASADAVAAGHDVDNGVKSNMLGDLDVGRTLNEKGDIADRTQEFVVGDSVCASVDADHLQAGKLTATLKKASGEVVASDSVTITSGQENASFHLGNAPTAGIYTVTVTSDSGQVESQTFSVR